MSIDVSSLSLSLDVDQWSAWDGVVDTLPATQLSQMDAVALLGRFDEKYLVPAASAAELVGRVSEIGDLAVLEVDGHRNVTYSTTYFDGPGRELFAMHRQGRRRRYKVRTRRYGATGPEMLEVKAKDVDGRTLKIRTERSPGRFGARPMLNAAELGFVVDAVQQVYPDLEVPELSAQLVTEFDRVTMVEWRAGMRVTVDRFLRVRSLPGADYGGDSGVECESRWALVEFKSAERRPVTQPLLRSMGLRPRSVSKYCLGVGLVEPGVRLNRWMPAVRMLAPTP